MKTFKDLKFEPHHFADYEKYKTHKKARMEFPNGAWISVIFGDSFYSSEKDGTYEVYVSHTKEDNPMGYCTPRQVTKIMKRLQSKECSI